MTTKDIISLAWNNIKVNKLRSIITMLIMALGIFALILIVTAIDAAKNGLVESFSTMGANAFAIRYKDKKLNYGSGASNKRTKTGYAKESKQSKLGLPVTMSEALLFKDRYNFPNTLVGISIRAKRDVVVSGGSKKTNPDNTIFGGDPNYIPINGYTLAYGRNMTANEALSGANVCIIGNSIAKTLFEQNIARAVDAPIQVDGKMMICIGVLAEKNTSAFFNTGRVIIEPLNFVRAYYTNSQSSFSIAVMLKNSEAMSAALGEATAVFRPIRKLAVFDDDNFIIDKSDGIVQSLVKNLGFLQTGTLGIALITLTGAAIGLMNIMLVAVTERTKEIGLVKALGAKNSDVKNQFLAESVIISLMGAIVGIVSGVLVGNIVAVLFNSGLVIPWAWVIAAIVVCYITGLLAGLIPAIKASRLNPIVALRYE